MPWKLEDLTFLEVHVLYCFHQHIFCFFVLEKDRCKTCQGRKTVKERKILEVYIDKGMKDGQKITFTGEGDQEPGIEPGDIIIILDEKQHPVYRRSDLDLHTNMVCK